jgi:hypothetical protein
MAIFMTVDLNISPLPRHGRAAAAMTTAPGAQI